MSNSVPNKRIRWKVVAVMSCLLATAVAAGLVLPRFGPAEVSPPPALVTVDQLRRNLPAIEGKSYRVCGRLDVGFESNGLWSGRPLAGSELPFFISVYSTPSTRLPNGVTDLSGRPPFHDWVIVTGEFYSGGGFGHLGTSNYMLRATRVELTRQGCPGIGV